MLDPQTESAGGALANGSYFCKVTATTAAGETVAGDEVDIDVTGVNGTVNLTWSFRGAGTGYSVYRGPARGSENELIASIAVPNVNFFPEFAGRIYEVVVI